MTIAIAVGDGVFGHVQLGELTREIAVPVDRPHVSVVTYESSPAMNRSSSVASWSRSFGLRSARMPSRASRRRTIIALCTYFAVLGDHDDHHPAVVVGALARGEARVDESIHRAGRGRGIDAQRVGQLPHPHRAVEHEHVERVDLAEVEGVVTLSVDDRPERLHRRAATELSPRSADAKEHGQLRGPLRVRHRVGTLVRKLQAASTALAAVA